MKGIDKARHIHLVNALRQLEKLSTGQPGCACLLQTATYLHELEAMHQNYERLLDELAVQINAYEGLHNYVKIHFVAKKLKELKKIMPAGRPALLMLKEDVHLIYSP